MRKGSKGQSLVRLLEFSRKTVYGIFAANLVDLPAIVLSKLFGLYQRFRTQREIKFVQSPRGAVESGIHA